MKPAHFKPELRQIRPGISSPRSAFTLIEIMVVVAIMGIILSMGIPAIRAALHRDAMSQAVVDILDACTGNNEHPGARDQAILYGRVMELRFYPKESRFEVVPGALNPSASTAATPVADTSDKPKRGPTTFSAQLSDEVMIKMLDVNFLDARDRDVAVVHFFPNGTSDEFNIILQSSSGEWRRITLDIVTAIPEVIDVK